MKKRKKLVIGIIISIIFIISLLALVNFLSNRIFKPKLEKALEKILEQPVKIKKIDMNFAFGQVLIQGISIKNISGFPSEYLLTAEKVIIVGNFIPFWKRKLIVLRKLVIIEPEINIDYLSNHKFNLFALFSNEYSQEPPLASYDKMLVKASRKGIFIKKFLFKNARINFNDYGKGEPYLTVAEKVDIGVMNFTHWLWAKGLETLFIIKGQLKNEPVTDFEIQGKLNYLSKKEISGAVELAINNLHLVHFAPYYGSTFAHLEVESGLANIYARIKCDKNNLVGASKLVLKDYTLKAKDEEGASVIRIGESIKGESGRLELMFRLGGTIEEPTYTLSTDISEAKMRELFNRLPGLNLSGTLLEGARKATSGIGKQVGDMFGRLLVGKKKNKE